MSPTIALSGMAGLILLLLLGVPVYVSFLLVCLVGIFGLMGPDATGLFTNSILETLTTESFVAIPLYMMLGEVLFRTGGVELLYKSVSRMIGIIPGRLYVVSLVASTLLGAILGSAMATVAMLGRFVFPVMMSRGCDRKLSIGVILGGASLSPIIPPSVLAVLLATIANISVGDLLVAGILPGILMASGFALYAMTTAVLDPAVDGQTRAVQKDEDELSLARAVAQVLPILVVVFLVVGLVVFGIAQPTESAAIGIVGAVIISAVNGTLRSSILAQACLSAVATAATVLIIVSTAKLFSQLLAFTGTTTAFLALVSGMEVNRWVLFGVVMLVVLFACMFLDEVAVMLISVPILTPVVAHLGFDPIWFWMLLLINFTLGGITPPIGYVNFVFKSVAPADCTMEEIMGAAWPIVAVSCGCIVIMCIFPGIVTWIPYGMRSLH